MTQEDEAIEVPTVAAIVVNWNGGALAVRAVASLLAQTLRPAIWLVDNGSSDGSPDRIAELSSGIQVIRNSANRGFAAANNQALRLCDGSDYILLMNNDAWLPEETALERVVARCEADRSIHGACGRYEYPDGRFQGYYNTLPGVAHLGVCWGIGRYVRPLRRSRALRTYMMEGADFSQPMMIEQPAFACVLMRGSSARAVGLMDESFPIFFNDVDYCWRWRARGWGWHYFPDWRVVHHQYFSTDRLGAFAQAEARRCAVRFARKHFSLAGALLVRAAVTLDALWQKTARGRLDGSIRDIWHGRVGLQSALHPK